MEKQSSDIRSLAVINFILGAWLIISPYLFGYTSTAAKWSQVILGIVVLVLAGVRAVAPSQRWLSGLMGIAALWGIMAPFVLSYNGAQAYWNAIIVSAVVAVLAFWNSGLGISRDSTHGGGHHSPA